MSVSFRSLIKMSDPIVTVAGGAIRGSLRKDVEGEIFLGFEGIPYGQPPTRSLRFKDPIPARAWSGIKDCTKLGPGSVCKQHKVLQDEATGQLSSKWVLEGSEDCLNLNVYTRKLGNSGSELKPVMFFIHGGAYVMGNCDYYGPERLITKDIVLVSFHYRLGAFGFLYMEDITLGVGGNAAMKDTVLALKWVKYNISRFNGDPENITVFGHSAGAASAAYLTMSPLASGLFHKVIIQSLSALSHATITQEDNARKLAMALGCEETEDVKILQYLQSLPPEKIYEGQLKFPDVSYQCSYRMFCPRIESKLRTGAFLNENPIELLKTGRYQQVPIMIGYTDMESILFMEFNKESPFNVVCFEEDTLTPVCFGFEQGTKEFQDVARKIRKFYYGEEVPEYISLPTVKMFSDMTIIRDVIKSCEYLSKTSKCPTYLYRFSIPKKHGEAFVSKNINGATHGDELPYLFKMIIDPENSKQSEKLLKLWTDFAKYGDPTMRQDEIVSLEWKPISKDHLYYLDIGEELSLKEDPEAERMAFWKELFNSYPQTQDY